MILSNCHTTQDLRAYVGNSKCYKKALRASKRKWKGNVGFSTDLCGFCFVLMNYSSKPTCGICPVAKFCRGRSTSPTFVEDNGKTLQFLNSPELKKLIANSKAGQTFEKKEQL